MNIRHHPKYTEVYMAKFKNLGATEKNQYKRRETAHKQTEEFLEKFFCIRDSATSIFLKNRNGGIL